MSSQQQDHWNRKDYTNAADFVHKLTTKVLQYLAPTKNDSILDIGCGDGPLTAQIAELSHSVLGLDASANFISEAKTTYSDRPNLQFQLQDCAHLEGFAASHAITFDKVFSNAALHWILREPTIRVPTITAIAQLLKPGGVFVFEMGGAGNVAEVHSAFILALMHAGFSPSEARECSPWFFPSDVLMTQICEKAGMKVEKMELEYRPTLLESGEKGGLEGWVRLMGATMLAKVEESKKEGIVREVCQACKDVCGREEGGEYLGYVRLRGVVRKPL